jgi:hypothetical protein
MVSANIAVMCPWRLQNVAWRHIVRFVPRLRADPSMPQSRWLCAH